MEAIERDFPLFPLGMGALPSEVGPPHLFAEGYKTIIAECLEGELAAMSGYDMAATVDFGLEAKQGLLDLRSENARLRLVTRLFRAAARRLDFVERAQARARSNGKVRFG